MAERTPRLLDQIRQRLRVLHYSKRTEKAYVDWVQRFLRFHRTADGTWRHPRDMGGPEVTEYLTHLAVSQRVAASTQNQALAALLFLYQPVLETELPLARQRYRFRARADCRPRGKEGKGSSCTAAAAAGWPGQAECQTIFHAG